jgi:hypothetical protein
MKNYALLILFGSFVFLSCQQLNLLKRTMKQILENLPKINLIFLTILNM